LSAVGESGRSAATAAAFQTGKDGSGFVGAACLRLGMLDHDAPRTGSQAGLLVAMTGRSF